ncbi:MAG: carboxynorspermidine decarboxylase [Campylobacterota bacterium]|nr:carboxynorspermidine decarboxylase [Campylobacterota bacterium]
MNSNSSLPSPCFVCEEELLEKNLKLLKYIQDEADINILLALKGFAMYSTFDMCKKYLKGCCASGLNEAILAKEEFSGEVHTYSPAFKPNEFEQISQISDHIVFNSFSQLKLYKDKIKPHNSIGLRINPEISTVDVDLYNPCSPYSRLGITKKQFNELPKIVEGLHFHALCEQNSDDFEKVLEKFEQNFSKYFPQLQWVNFGGGHLITKDNYDIEKLIIILRMFKLKYPYLKVYLEPGEAIGWETGYLESTVLDIVHNEIKIAILDTSAEAHMPDTLAMPYRPNIRNSGKIAEKEYNYRIAGNTCLAGDIIGDYSFDEELKVGNKIILEDMIHYTMVKTTTFNGINLPSIAIKRKNNSFEIIKNYNYKSYKDRL